MLCDMEGRHSMDTVPHRLRGKVDLDNFEKAGGTAAHGAPPDAVRTTTISRGKLPLTLRDEAAPSSATRLRYWPTATAPAP